MNVLLSRVKSERVGDIGLNLTFALESGNFAPSGYRLPTNQNQHPISEVWKTASLIARCAFHHPTAWLKSLGIFG
jgi:hypothetical protein